MVLRLVAEEAPRFAYRQQSVVRPKPVGERRAREAVLDEVSIWKAYNGFGVRHDEHLGAAKCRLERLAHRLGAVAGVDIAPQVPAPLVRRELETRELRVALS